MSEPVTLRINEIDYVRKDSLPAPVEYSRKEGPWEIGQFYYIETVTKYYHGRLVDVTDKELVISEAAWIADTGRFWNFITLKAKPSEVEPFSPGKIVLIGRGALVSATQLPDQFKEQK
jgi:hypothetical protein